MDAFDDDDELDVAAEDALLFGTEPPAAIGDHEPRAVVPPAEGDPAPIWSQRVRNAARLVEQQEDGSEQTTSEPLFVSEQAAEPARVEAPVAARSTARRVEPEEARVVPVADRLTVGDRGRKVAVVGALAAVALGVGTVVLPSLNGGKGGRDAVAASPVPSATPAPVTRTVTVIAPRREKQGSAPTSPRPKAARRVRAKRPQAAPRAAAPAAPAVRSAAPAAPVYRPPVYRAPSAGRSADAAFGVRTP